MMPDGPGPYFQIVAFEHVCGCFPVCSLAEERISTGAVKSCGMPHRLCTVAVFMAGRPRLPNLCGPRVPAKPPKPMRARR